MQTYPSLLHCFQRGHFQMYWSRFIKLTWPHGWVQNTGLWHWYGQHQGATGCSRTWLQRQLWHPLVAKLLPQGTPGLLRAPPNLHKATTCFCDCPLGSLTQENHFPNKIHPHLRSVPHHRPYFSLSSLPLGLSGSLSVCGRVTVPNWVGQSINIKIKSLSQAEWLWDSICPRFPLTQFNYSNYLPSIMCKDLGFLFAAWGWG